MHRELLGLVGREGRVRFRDGDPLNLSRDNLALISTSTRPWVPAETTRALCAEASREDRSFWPIVAYQAAARAHAERERALRQEARVAIWRTWSALAQVARYYSRRGAWFVLAHVERAGAGR